MATLRDTSLPAQGNEAWYSHYQALDNDIRTGAAGQVALDSFAGANDDAKLTAALTYAAAQTYPPTITIGNRAHTFNTGGRTPFTGLSIWGSPGFNNPEQNGQTKMKNRITLNFSGGWFNNAATSVFGTSFGQLSFYGGENASVVTSSNDSCVWWCLWMHNISTTHLRSVIGTPTQRLTSYASQLTGGAWNIANSYGTAVHIGGSDSVLWSDGCLIDSGPFFFSAGGNAAGTPHIRLNYLEKSVIGPFFSTSIGGWSCIRSQGVAYNQVSTSNGGVNVIGARIEGKSAVHGDACNGFLVRVEGGLLSLDNCWVNFGMSDPTGWSPTPLGVIHQTGGWLGVFNTSYGKAQQCAETVPFIMTSGSSTVCHVDKLRRVATVGTGWTGLPRIQVVNGASLNPATFTQI